MESAKEKRRDVVISLAVLAAFILSLSLLIAAMKLLQQNLKGFGPALLLVFSLFGIASSIFIFITNFSKQQLEPVPLAAATEIASRFNEQETVLVDNLEKHNQNLLLEKQKLEGEILELKGQITWHKTQLADWQSRSIELFRTMERVINSEGEIDPNYILALERTKRHFARLVQPLGVLVIEPKQGDPFDDLLHQVVEDAGDHSLPPWVVVSCQEWGYSVNSQVETPAKVVISRRG